MAENDAKWHRLASDTDDRNILMEIFYSAEQGQFRLDVSHGEEKLSKVFNGSYSPGEGMDIISTITALRMSEDMANQIEQKLNL